MELNLKFSQAEQLNAPIKKKRKKKEKLQKYPCICPICGVEWVMEVKCLVMDNLRMGRQIMICRGQYNGFGHPVNQWKNRRIK